MSVRSRLGIFMMVATTMQTVGGPLNAQSKDVVVVVTREVDGTPLQNAEVVVLNSDQRRFTGSDGMVRMRAPVASRLRVRQLGYAFKDIAMAQASVAGAAVDTIRIQLQATAFALPQVRTTTPSACEGLTPSDGDLEVWALSQLREGAERYESFRKQYPFDVNLERRTVTAPQQNSQKIVDSREKAQSGNWGERYERGEVVRYEGLGFSVSILFLATLGDAQFWEHHCPVKATVVGDSSRRVVRLSFVPGNTIKETDWEGEAYMDSATSVLSRVDFRLRVSGRDTPRRMEGYSTFWQASPGIVVPDTTIAYWWRRDPASGEWGLPDVIQRIQLSSFKFRREPP